MTAVAAAAAAGWLMVPGPASAAPVAGTTLKGIVHVVPSIEGGTRPAAGAWPWMVSVVAVDGSGNSIQGCSGVLIGPTTVLTAAHCLDGSGASAYVVTSATSLDWSSQPYVPPSPSETVTASDVSWDPDFNFTTLDYGDVGIVPLALPLPGTSYVPLVQPDQMSAFQTVFNGLIAGYGITLPGAGTYGTLYQLELTGAYVDNIASPPDGGPLTDTGGGLIDYTEPGETGPCDGDSGGPLLVPISGGDLRVTTNPTPSNGDWAVIGLTHRGNPSSCNIGSYTNVAFDGAGDDVAAWLAPYETPVSYVAPAVTGTAVAGQQLTCSPGTWSTTASYSYTWQTVTGGITTVIDGATASTYTPAPAQAGLDLECAVQATVTGFGSSNTVTSQPVTILAAPAAVALTATIKSSRHTATFHFVPTGTGTATSFQCALIKRKTNGKYPAPSFAVCRSPKAYKHLKKGSYKFEVRAVNAAGHGTPATKRFTIA